MKYKNTINVYLQCQSDVYTINLHVHMYNHIWNNGETVHIYI